jgi:DNA-binding transcriptional LysR family regulator
LADFINEGEVVRLEIKLFKTFLLVAKLLNITKAAEQLSFSQPAITAQICSLEDAFHVQLFKRTGKRLTLTMLVS